MTVRKRILVLTDLPPELHRRLAAHCEVVVDPIAGGSEARLAAAIGGFHGLLCLLTQRVTARVLAGAKQLEIVANCAVGCDNIDLAAAELSGVAVTNTPDVLTADTADLTWALILAVARRIVPADAWLRRGKFKGWEPHLFLGRSLSQLTLGVVGAGRIGQAVLARARGFGVRRLYNSRRRLPPSRENELGAEWRDLDPLLLEADIVSLHVPLGPETHHLLDGRRLRAMRKGALLINTCRGPVVDEDALVEVLAGGHLTGAGLDVYEREPEVHPGLLELRNVVLLPHIGSATQETRFRMMELCVEALLEQLVEGRRPKRALALEVRA